MKGSLSLPQDVETASDLRIDLDAKLASLRNELDFVTKTQEEVWNILGASFPSAEQTLAMICLTGTFLSCFV